MLCSIALHAKIKRVTRDFSLGKRCENTFVIMQCQNVYPRSGTLLRVAAIVLHVLIQYSITTHGHQLCWYSCKASCIWGQYSWLVTFGDASAWYVQHTLHWDYTIVLPAGLASKHELKTISLKSDRRRTWPLLHYAKTITLRVRLHGG